MASLFQVNIVPTFQPFFYNCKVFLNDDTQNISSLDYNKWLKHLDTQLNEPTNQNAIKVTKVVEPTNKKTVL